jgi:hypothetical protein
MSANITQNNQTNVKKQHHKYYIIGIRTFSEIVKPL